MGELTLELDSESVGRCSAERIKPIGSIHIRAVGDPSILAAEREAPGTAAIRLFCCCGFHLYTSSSGGNGADFHDPVGIDGHVVELAVKSGVDAHGVVDRIQSGRSRDLFACRGIAPNCLVPLIRPTGHVVGADDLPSIWRPQYGPERKHRLLFLPSHSEAFRWIEVEP